MSAPSRILVAEDNRADVVLVRLALDSRDLNYTLNHVQDGEQAIDVVHQAATGAAPVPDLILLDINLPKREGDEVLAEIRKQGAFANVPVVIFTSSDSPRDIERTTALGATRYFRKPSDFDQFMTLGAIVEELLHGGGAGRESQPVPERVK